jgi:hypothetical protein
VDVSSAAVIILFGLVALRWVVVGIGAALLLRPVQACPACFAPTFLLYRRWLRRLMPWMEWRWCPRCGWHGPARRVVSGHRTRPQPGRKEDPPDRQRRLLP